MKFLTVLPFAVIAAAVTINIDPNSIDSIELRDENHHIGTSGENHMNVSDLNPVPHVPNHKHGVPILQTDLKPQERLYWENYNTTTFLTADNGDKNALYTHMTTILLTTFFIYPLSMVAKNEESKLYIPFFAVHIILMAISLISLSVYGKSAPTDLYPNNAYSKMSIILFFTTICHVISAIVYMGTKSDSNSHSTYKKVNDEETGSTEELYMHHSSADSSDWDHNDRDELNRIMNEKMFQPSKFNKYLEKASENKYLGPLVKGLCFFARWIGLSNNIIYNCLHWGHFFYFLVYIPTGAATVFCLGRGNKVFNLLAHFIKGGVFFCLGLLSLARYCGGFTNIGWAWNSKIVYKFSSKRWLITMEMVESSLILFYGCTNIFMEHLANPGGAWSAKDLQHVSIAFIYIGSGLCGVITELKLKSWRIEKGIEKLKNSLINESESCSKEIDYSSIINASPGYSPNPFPLFTIFWTGVLMSKHSQASELSTEIHVQWGNLFVYGTVFRFMTYLLMSFLPVTYKHLTLPSKPITELLTSFCLLCGGLVFMESADPVVHAFEYRGFSAMFTLNLSLGFIALFMAWEMILFSFKDWLSRRQRREI